MSRWRLSFFSSSLLPSSPSQARTAGTHLSKVVGAARESVSTDIVSFASSPRVANDESANEGDEGEHSLGLPWSLLDELLLLLSIVQEDLVRWIQRLDIVEDLERLLSRRRRRRSHAEEDEEMGVCVRPFRSSSFPSSPSFRSQRPASFSSFLSHLGLLIHRSAT